MSGGSVLPPDSIGRGGSRYTQWRVHHTTAVFSDRHVRIYTCPAKAKWESIAALMAEGLRATDVADQVPEGDGVRRACFRQFSVGVDRQFRYRKSPGEDE